MSLGFENLKEDEEEEEEEDLFCQKQKQNCSTNIIKHRGVFPEGHMAIVLDISSKNENNTSNIIFLKKKNSIQYITRTRKWTYIYVPNTKVQNIKGEKLKLKPRS